ncbi:MAG: hypothetical protein HY680_00205 [Chloroflexi bacterium]|nr:hypothetical protein [Chloroflexota bacterium]
MVTKTPIKVADQVWIALALLLRGNTEAEGFSVSQIKDRVRQEFGHVAPGIEPHIRQHCLADKEPRPGRYRMLVKVAKDKYRLFREGDFFHPDRENAKTKPHREEIPELYHSLLAWYAEEYAPEVKYLSLDSLLLKVKPGRSGYTDVSVNHDAHLAQILWEEFHEATPKQNQ